MNNEKVRTYDELNVGEDLVDILRTMKLSYDQARFELYSYCLNDIIEKYENLIEMRKDTQALLFEMLEQIDKCLTTIHVSPDELDLNREVELNNINGELNIIQEYKTGFDEALSLIYDGTIEQILIEEENSW